MGNAEKSVNVKEEKYNEVLERNYRETSEFIRKDGDGNYTINFDLIKGNPARKEGGIELEKFWNSLDTTAKNKFGEFLVKYFTGMGTGTAGFSTLSKIIDEYEKQQNKGNPSTGFDMDEFKKIALGKKAEKTKLYFTVKTAYSLGKKYLNKNKSRDFQSTTVLTSSVMQKPENPYNKLVDYANKKGLRDDNIVMRYTKGEEIDFFVGSTVGSLKQGRGPAVVRLTCKTGIFDGESAGNYMRGIEAVYNGSYGDKRTLITEAHKPITLIVKRVGEYDRKARENDEFDIIQNEMWFILPDKTINITKEEWENVKKSIYEKMESGKLHQEIMNIKNGNYGLSDQQIADIIIVQTYNELKNQQNRKP